MALTMCQPLYQALYKISSFNPDKLHEVRTVIIPVLPVTDLKLGEVSILLQASKWWN